MELVLMMQPFPAARMIGSTALQPWNTAVTFRSIMLRNASGE